MRKTLGQKRLGQVCDIPEPPEIRAARGLEPQENVALLRTDAGAPPGQAAKLWRPMTADGSGLPESPLDLDDTIQEPAPDLRAAGLTDSEATAPIDDLDRAFEDSPTVLSFKPQDDGRAGADHVPAPAARAKAGVPGSDLCSADDGDLPACIGPYEIVAVLGEGGQGVVYEAMQSNPRRPVALKVIRRSLKAEGRDLKLFRRESETLARLRHIGIAALYEVGEVPGGLHYFAMELVEGQPIHSYIEEQRPSLLEKLQLFLKICDAVSYAHQKGVIHRDLKPSNILVEDQGQPRILDFGLARIIDHDSANSLDSEADQVRGTPRYMSPEQVRGNVREIDVRSDVYTLGVILYEMLTGQMPYRFEGTGLYHAVQIICRQEPARPSRLNPNTRGDLEAILLKALEKDVPRRYQSVRELAEDIRRHLGHEPVSARRAGALYHMRKCIRRHRATSWALAVAVVMFAGFAIYTRSQSTHVQQALDARQEAEQAETRARQLTADVNELLQAMLTSASGHSTAADAGSLAVLDEAAGRIESVAGTPQTAAALHGAVGLSYRTQGRFEDAERHLRLALQGARQDAAHDPLQWATCAHQLGQVLADLGRFEEADGWLSKAFSVRNEILNPQHPDLAATLYDLAQTRAALGQHEQAKDMLRGALRTFETSPNAEAATATRLELAVMNQEPSTAVAEIVQQAEDASGGLRPESVEGLLALAAAKQREGQLSAAHQLYAEALGRLEGSLPADHPQALEARERLIEVLCLTGQLDLAQAKAESLLSLQESRWGSWHAEVARALALGAQIRQLQGDAVGAEPMYRRALTMYRTTTPADDPGAREYLLGLLRCLMAQNRWQEALAVIDQIDALRDDGRPDRIDRYEPI